MLADAYGNNVYIDDSTAVVAAYSYSRPSAPGQIGAVYIYTRQGSQWVKTGFISNPSQTTSTFGWALAKSGTDLVIGNGDSNIALTKSVFVYRQPPVPTQPWTLVATLTPSATTFGYDYGYSVAIDRDNLIVGAVDRFTRGRNAAHFYHRTPAGVWQLEQVESYASGTLASNTVGVRGNYAVIGTDSNQGVRIYARTAAGWQLRQTLFSPDSFGGRFGLAVAISNNVLLVGNPTGGVLPVLCGVVFRYELQQGVWRLQRRYAVPQPLTGDALGVWVGLDPASNNLIIGAPRRTSNGIAQAGQAFVEWGPVIQPPPSLCATALPVLLQATGPGGTWAGPGITNPQTGRFDPARAGVGAHVITYLLVAGGCTHRDTAVVTVKPELRITRPVLPQLTCARDTTITLAANAPGGQWSGLGITDPQTGAFHTAAAGPGRHVLSYTLSSGSLCGMQDTVSVVVGAVAVRLLAVPRLFSCAHDTAFTLGAMPLGGTWHGAGVTNPTTGTFSTAAAGPGRHVLTYRLPGTGACASQDTVSVVIAPVAVRVLTPLLTVCRLDSTLTLSAVPVGGVWRGTGIIDAQQGYFRPPAPGRYVLRYEWGSGACRAADSVAVVVSPVPTPLLAPSGVVELRCGQSAGELRYESAPLPGARLVWQYAPAPGLPWQMLAVGNGQPTYQPAQPGLYRLEVVQNGCSVRSAATEIRVETVQTWPVPNVFTPNGDGINDAFELKLQHPRTSRLQVFNRWGREVFTATTYGHFWTGTGASNGLYYYIWRYTTECDPAERVVKGWVEVVL
ncbi:gliding motility-associated C-terminal domain-containing protein [Hymenobacter sp. BT683]|uniref:Gliding motility-associated C-terminal domain-containing protein n=1 Tax=Hymenobacter jeongseonensis TaxID=2791027 RepID=A0ABS0IEI9_9BACT|nr:gliding motility-associated C-terminal domain-containing protein [Hymenobacter jeongseonensis]MBF9236270.1 gliding motility-associated C-terminal domain-containing protein [Hymenobacter jeongseonensis]